MNIWLPGYCGVNGGPLSNDLPLTPIALARLERGEPPVLRQNLGRLDCVLSVEADGTGGELIDVFRGDGWLGPALEPIEHLLGEILVRWFDHRFGWSSLG